LGAKGEAWFEDVLLQHRVGSNPWVDIIGPTAENYSFENEGSTHTFSEWWDPPLPVTVQVDLANYRKDRDQAVWPQEDPNQHDHKGCHMISPDRPAYTIPNPTPDQKKDSSYWKYEYPLEKKDGDLIIDPPILQNTSIRIGGFMRTKKVDTGRLCCPWQWKEASKNFVNPSNPLLGKYLGGVAYFFNWWYDLLPYQTSLQHRSNDAAGIMGVASWYWYRDYPVSYKLDDIWFDPFKILEKEVPWGILG
jgi:hypothetical protein